MNAKPRYGEKPKPIDNSKIKKKRKSFLSILRVPVLIVGLVLASIAGVLVFNSHWIRIETVQIDLDEASQEDLLFQRIKQTLQVQFESYAGKFFWQVPLEGVYELTLKDKRVKKVSIYREFPSRLRVQIEPRTPILGYLSSDNRIYPVATDATLLPPLSAKEAPDLPLLRGEDLKDEKSLRELAIELYEKIPDDGLLKKQSISEIIYTKKDGFKIFLSGTQAEVKVGDTDFGPKVSRVQKVLSYLDSQNIKGRVIDARFSKKVVVRVRNTP